MFTSSNSKKFLKNNKFFYKSLTVKSARFPYFKMATFCCVMPSQTEKLKVLWLGLAKCIQNVSITLQETFIFLCMQKIN